jgi:hypothetical protein
MISIIGIDVDKEPARQHRKALLVAPLVDGPFKFQFAIRFKR